MRKKEPTQQYSDLINSLQSRIQALEDENRLLKGRLDEAGHLAFDKGAYE